MKPPRLAVGLLLAALPHSHADSIAGDLEEEFVSLADLCGRKAANRWYVGQVARSILPLWRRAGLPSLGDLFLTNLLSVTLPLLLLDYLWAFVYSCVPLKAGLDRDARYLAGNVFCVLFCAIAVGIKTRGGLAPAATAGTIALAAAGGIWGATGVQPAVYVAAVLLLAPAGGLLGSILRR